MSTGAAVVMPGPGTAASVWPVGLVVAAGLAASVVVPGAV